MNRCDIERRARLIIAQELSCDVGKVRDDADFRADLKADSLDMVQLPAALEEEFGIQITDDEAEFCETVGTAIDVIWSKIEDLLNDQARRPAIGGRAMTLGGGSRLGALKGARTRQAEKEAGMAAARLWRAQHHPVPAFGHMPFAGHRTCAEWTESSE